MRLSQYFWQLYTCWHIRFPYEFPLCGMEVVVLSKGGGRHSVLIAYSSHRRCLHYDSAPFRKAETHKGKRKCQQVYSCLKESFLQFSPKAQTSSKSASKQFSHSLILDIKIRGILQIILNQNILRTVSRVSRRKPS